MAQTILFDFSHDMNISNWRIVNDVVMGGRSDASMRLTPEGHGEFSGHVSTRNNGGFASVRQAYNDDVASFTHFELSIKGDGKDYQFRVRDNRRHRYSYIYSFKTTGEWQTISIPIQDMIPTFRGRKLDLPDYAGEDIVEVAFLIGNKVEEDFVLLIDKILIK